MITYSGFYIKNKNVKRFPKVENGPFDFPFRLNKGDEVDLEDFYDMTEHKLIPNSRIYGVVKKIIFFTDELVIVQRVELELREHKL